MSWWQRVFGKQTQGQPAGYSAEENADVWASISIAAQTGDKAALREAFKRRVACAKCKRTFLVSKGLGPGPGGNGIQVICPGCQDRLFAIRST